MRVPLVASIWRARDRDFAELVFTIETRDLVRPQHKGDHDERSRSGATIGAPALAP